MNPLAVIGWQRYLVYGALLAAAGAVIWFHGLFTGRAALHEYKAKQAIEAVRIVRQVETLKETVRVPYVKRETDIITRYIEIEKEAAHVASRSECNVTAGWMRVHDAAASDRRIEGAVDDAADTGVAEHRALAEAIVPNYKAFHQVANDLVACRAFVGGLPRATR